MQEISDRNMKTLYKLQQLNGKGIYIRRSMELFEHRPQKLVYKHNTNYKALKKPLLSFQEGLHYVHKLCQARPKPSPKARTISRSAIPYKRSPVIKSFVKSQRIESPIMIDRSHTPIITKSYISQRMPSRIVPDKVVLDKIKIMGQARAFNNVRTPAGNQIEDLNGWLVDSFNYF